MDEMKKRTKSTSSGSSSSHIKGRPKPSAPRAGFKASGSRYDCGGKLKK